MNLEVIIGLEIHAHISTDTKMFCGCSNHAFDARPNQNVCPVCAGHPGALPVPNREAITKGLIAALALGCTIRSPSKFDRKNYFYPDLPSGYQISQFDEPVSEHGAIDITLSSGVTKTIRVHRLHLENDAGKLTHVGASSLVDFNRAGCPLMEIVSEPDMRTPEEARLYAEAIQHIVQFVGSSDADMYKGHMRFDASISLRPMGEEKLYPRAEIKNLNSFKALELAIHYEIRRQTKLWEMGTPSVSEQTLGWDDDAGETYLLREKESAADYRYFPEPDIPPMTFSDAFITSLRDSLPELPVARRARFIADYALSPQEATTLTATRELADYFEAAVHVVVGDQPSQELRLAGAKKTAGWVATELSARMNDAGITSLAAQKITAASLGTLVKLIINGTISGKIAKDIFPTMWETGDAPEVIIEAKGLRQVSDTGAIETFVDEVIAANEKSIADYRAGKQNAFSFLVGQVMKLSKGQANPGMVNEMIAKKIK